MAFLKSLRIRPPDDPGAFPYRVPAIAELVSSGRALRFHRAVTFFVGDNGSGKSTLLEAIAVHQGLNAEGGSRGMRFETRSDTVSALHRQLRIDRRPLPPTDGFFLRAESYFNVATAVEGYGMQEHYGGSPHDRSHGESFIDLVVHRFQARGLYLLDEPEAALSIHGQLQLLVRLDDLVAEGCQFVIATHSPVLAAFPDAAILSFTDRGIEEVDWADLDSVVVTSDFLRDPTSFLEELFRDD